MPIDLEQFSEAELIDLNRRIVARLKALQESNTQKAMLEFRVGDRVVFEPSEGRTKVGTLIRFNRKSVTVITDHQERWNVAPTLLQKLAPDVASNVVPIKRGGSDEARSS